MFPSHQTRHNTQNFPRLIVFSDDDSETESNSTAAAAAASSSEYRSARNTAAAAAVAGAVGVSERDNGDRSGRSGTPPEELVESSCSGVSRHIILHHHQHPPGQHSRSGQPTRHQGQDLGQHRLSAADITMVPANTPDPGLAAPPSPDDRASRRSTLSLVAPGINPPCNTPRLSPAPPLPTAPQQQAQQDVLPLVQHREKVRPTAAAAAAARPLSPVILNRSNLAIGGGININSTDGDTAADSAGGGGKVPQSNYPSSSDDILASSGSSRKSSVRYSSYLLPTLSVPPFEHTRNKLSPVPLALSPYSYSPSSAISLRLQVTAFMANF